MLGKMQNLKIMDKYYLQKENKKNEQLLKNSKKISDKSTNSYNKLKRTILGFKDHEEQQEDLEIDNLIKFAENLDYEKYLKNLEIKEAINLIKLKVEKEKAKEEKEEELTPFEFEELAKAADDTENKLEEGENPEESTTNNIEVKVVNHEKDWNETKTNLEKEESKYKQELISKLMKTDQVIILSYT